ncbi:MAG: ferritin family protein [Fibrobacterota bacterium]
MEITKGQSMHDLSKLIDFAIQEEENARALYLRLGAKVQDKGARTLLNEMAAMEEGHAKKLANFRAVKKHALLGDTAPDLMIAEYTVAKPLTEKSGVQDVILFAIQCEASANKMYTDLASLSVEPAVKSLFQGLAADELSHKKSLEQAYDENILREN